MFLMQIGECWKTVGNMLEGSRAKALFCELGTRTLLWLLFGKVPAISFETDELKTTITERRPHELRTAGRLSRNGVRPKFVQDVKKIFDPIAHTIVQVGMADLDNGYELKTLEKAATFSAIDGYLRRAAKKENTVAVVFDNTDNKGMSDETLKTHVVAAKRRFKGRVYVLCQDGNYRRAK